MEPLIDVRAAAGLLSLSPYTIRKYIRLGKLRPVRIGRRVLLEPSELERLVAHSKRDEDRRNPEFKGYVIPM